jgi:hypothetical protein
MTSRLARPVTLVALLALMAFGLAAPAAADVTCTGTIGAQTVDDNLIVPDGASCTLEGTTVQGNVLVGQQATLTATGITVDGDIQDDNGNAGDVRVADSRIIGNIQLEQGTSATILRTEVDGDLQWESNRGPLRAEGNVVDGNLQANQNTGGLEIVRNEITGNLQCQANNPAPTGSGNVVHGSAEDQCASLTGEPSPPPGDDEPTPPPGDTTARDTSRLAGADRFETAVRITQAAYPDGAPVVYLARADAFADALAGSNLTDGPILLVPACGDVPQVVLAEIRRLDPQRVTALGGASAVCDAVLDAASRA